MLGPHQQQYGEVQWLEGLTVDWQGLVKNLWTFLTSGVGSVVTSTISGHGDEAPHQKGVGHPQQGHGREEHGAQDHRLHALAGDEAGEDPAAIPLTSVAYSLFRDYVNRRLKEKKLKVQ